MVQGEQGAQAPKDSIEGSGYPLGFKLREGRARSTLVSGAPGRDVFRVEARHMTGHHQKECVVHEGATGSAWRLVSDEGLHLKGTDLAPFPLGFYNAGLCSDLINRILGAARGRGIPVKDLAVDLHNIYSFTGSFFRGTGVGSADPAKITIKIDSPASADAVEGMVREAATASPALATMRVPLTNTFALHVNGRRRGVTTMPASTAPDASDPFLIYTQAPAPLTGAGYFDNIIYKTGGTEAGQSVPSSPEPKSRHMINIFGHSHLIDPAGLTDTTLRLGFPGTTHYAIKGDERPDVDQAPSGLALATAAITFCYMTQLSRYIDHMKLKIRNVRIVQSSPYSITGGPAHDDWSATAEPIDTHLFLSGEETEEAYENLMNVAARTCYLHAATGATLPPELTIEHRSMAAV